MISNEISNLSAISKYNTTKNGRAIFIPIATLGEIKDSQKLIIRNRFLDVFSNNYDLVPQEEYELHNQSVDVSYTFGEDYTFSLGAGFIVSGEAKSSTLNLESTDVSGYRAMGLLGTNFGRWEALGGYQYSSFEYKNFSTTKNLTLSGGLMVFGIGMGF